MGNTTKKKINKDDQILRFLNECGIATRKHLEALTKRENSWLHESLTRMVVQKKLYCSPPRKKLLPAKRVFNKAVVYATYKEIEKRTTFDHDLPITDLYVALYLTGRLSEWYAPRQKFDGALNEDRTFVWDAGDSEIDFYLEYETGKNNWSQIEERLRKYVELRKEKRFNVLYVLESEQHKSLKGYIHRAENFIPEADRSKWKLFLFVMRDEFIENPLGQIYRTAYFSGKDSDKSWLSPDLVK